MAKNRGMDVMIKLADTTVDAWTSDGIDLTKQMLDATTADSTDEWNENLSGFKSGTLPIEGKWEEGTSNYNLEELFDLFDGTSSAAFVFGRSTVGAVTYSGNCYVSAFRITADMGNVPTWAATLIITGKVTRGTVSE